MKKRYFTFLILFLPSYLFAQPLSCPNATIIGNTDYEAQSVGGSCGRLIFEWPDNSMAAVWTIGFGMGTFPDRGTGYNFYSNGTWDTPPSGRIETVRTGFPNIFGGNNSDELIFCHEVQNAYKLSRNSNGTGPWVEEPISPITQFWPRFTRGGSNGQTIHLVANEQWIGNGQQYSLKYWRSPDNGLTWDITDLIIPVLDSSNTLMISPSKNISSRGNVVAIVTGGFTDDLILCKSLDNGTTWSKTIINQFPIPLYDAGNMITDINNDMIADTITTVDRTSTLVIDNNNNVHVWAGRTRIVDEDLPASFGYLPAEDGVVYWNETMPANTLLNTMIAEIEDLNNDGIINIPVISDPNDCGATSMVSAGINAWNHLFVTYSAYMEDTINPVPSPLEAKRNVYVQQSVDNGQTWTAPLRVCPEDMENQLFPSMAEFVYNDPKIIYFRDTINQLTQPDRPLEVVFVSPDISTGVPGSEGLTPQLTIWQDAQNNTMVINIIASYRLSNASLEIIDISGREVSKQNLSTNDYTFNGTINMEGIASGSYFVKLRCENGMTTKKFIFGKK